MSWAIQVENLSKRYRMGTAVTPVFDNFYEVLQQKFSAIAGNLYSPKDNIKVISSEEISSISSNLVLTPEQQKDCPDGHFWALRDVSFEVNVGERVGIVGKNGSGKSTLLKILSRITQPTLGQYRYRGRLVSLLEVGTGFHPDLTGKENIFLNATINGMSSKSLNRIYDEIVDFSELGPQINTPLKRYSSGMYMRLAFSVAAHLESEILIVDEVLAVGDAGFQKKCLDKMLEISGRGRTLLFVSHDMSAVSTLCSKALILSHGALIEAPAGEESRNNHAKHAQEHGLLEINSAISQYIMNGKMTSEVVWEANSAPSYPKGEVVIQTVSLRNKKNVVQGIFDISEDVCVSVEYKVTQLKWSLNTHIYIQSMTGQRLLMSMDNQCSDYSNQLKQIGSYTEICTIPGNLLNEGSYRVELVICTNPTSNVNIVLPDVLCFTMIDERRVGSVRGDWTREWPNYPIRSPMTWEITHT